MEFRELDRETQHEMMEFIKDFDLYAEVTAGGRDYVLVHAGLGNFSPEKELWEYSLHELIWTRPDYNEQYYPDKYVVTGHTPTRFIEENPRPDRIFRNKNHIAIDCGANIPGGRLAAICLDTDEEFYVDNPEKG
jgi:serine/threonine protein phosphatase 1